MTRPLRACRNGMLDVECRLLHVFFWALLLAPILLRAQAPQQLPPGGLIQIQVPQPVVDVSAPVTATAAFDPPVVRPGEKTFYRVTVSATESSIQWPDEIAAPAELKIGARARGQITQQLGNNSRSLTTFLYEIHPTTAGHFTIANFTVNAFGQMVAIPAANLGVTAENPSSIPPRQIILDSSATNVFLGQPFRVRVLLPAGPANEIEALREIQFNGGDLMADKTAMRNSVEQANVNGQSRPASICYMVVTPIAAGLQTVSAQGFTAGREFSGPISISGQVTISGGPAKYDLLVSEPVAINVRPLPVDGGLPGFTGAIGKFTADGSMLSTNRVRVGEPLILKCVFNQGTNLARFVPPEAPRSREWQIIADKPVLNGSTPLSTTNSFTNSFTLIPLTDEATNTPAIPFSCFDPEIAKYVDLTIPPLPVTVVGESLPVQLPVSDVGAESTAPLKLSGLATTPGKTMSSLQPLQLRGWFACLLPVPLMGFLALWQWDRRRRFLEAHPEIIRRRQARRALRRERRALEKAASASDVAAFVHHAASAMKISCAPHFPAHPRALVCADVLAQLEDADQTGHAAETVKAIFGAADAQYSGTGVPPVRTELPMERTGGTPVTLLTLAAEVDAVLQKLEEKL